ncbi:hypothetical protein OTERR_12600 [Oryzomicrobium terrae]|uniref:Uncharacterized protein n=1 Tax=Oryzomicrobium terrae TaxID=1735038 RepID=A0A5C1E733_9RHOO|nr:hypothetical protein OTERR_12600 [Oryzomicrobium terrae]
MATISRKDVMCMAREANPWVWGIEFAKEGQEAK